MNNEITKPMLAGTVTDFSKIKFPVLATPMIDGIRCLRINGKSLSRSFKEIPNKHIQERMKDLPDWLDGELIIKGGFQKTTSGVMSQDGTPDFEYWIFDFVKDSLIKNYMLRLDSLRLYTSLPIFCIHLYPQRLDNLDEIRDYEEDVMSLGHEGIMIRQPNSPYKCGRSTEKEGYLLKIKRFEDAEAVIIGFEEQAANMNELKEDKFGLSKRSTSKVGKVGKNTLGAFVVRDLSLPQPASNYEFRVGTGVGLTKELRQKIWDNRKEYLGAIITYKYQKIGTLNLPRLPVFKGFKGDG